MFKFYYFKLLFFTFTKTFIYCPEPTAVFSLRDQQLRVHPDWLPKHISAHLGRALHQPEMGSCVSEESPKGSVTGGNLKTIHCSRDNLTGAAVRWFGFGGSRFVAFRRNEIILRCSLHRLALWRRHCSPALSAGPGLPVQGRLGGQVRKRKTEAT